jgi:predicted porin
LVDAGIWQNTRTSSGVGTTTRGVGPENNGFSELRFSGSEDLGNGLKASFQIGNNITADGGSSPTNRISFVGLSGGFGNVQIGQQWKPGFFTILAADPTRLVATTAAGAVGPGELAAYTANSITYTLPTFVEGLGVQTQKGYGESTTAGAGDSNGYSLTYTSGGLYAGFAAGTITAGSATTFTGNAIGTSTGTSLATLTAGVSKISSTQYTVAYDFGMAKVYVGSGESKVNSTTSKHSNTTYGISAPVGPIVVGYLVANGKTTNGSGTNGSESGTRLAAFYELSKRTQVYAFNGKSKLGGSTDSLNSTALGLLHAF